MRRPGRAVAIWSVRMTPSSHRNQPSLQGLTKSGGKKRGPERGGNCERTLVVTVIATAVAWPFGVTGLGERKQVAVSGSPLQLRSTLPVKPNSGLTFTV